MAKPDDPAHDARTLLEREKAAVLCTAHAGLDGWPFGSIVPYAVLPDGDPVVFLSNIAEHTKNVAKDPRVCLFLADPGTKDRPQTGARLAVLARAARAEGAAKDAAERAYFSRFPDAEAMRGTHGFDAYVLAVDRVRWIAGFGTMGWFERATWSAAQPDLLLVHAATMIEHLNEDHADAVRLLAARATAAPAPEARVTTLDHTGFDVEVRAGAGGPTSVRLAFPTPAATPVDVRKAVMAMVAAAKAAATR